METRKQNISLSKMNHFTKILKYFFLRLLFDILYAVPFILALPFVLIFLLFRYFFGIYLTLKHRQKIHFIPGPDAFFLLNTNEMIIHGFLIIRGKANLNDVRNRVKCTLTDTTKPDGSFKYARLRCCIQRSCGFSYWLPDNNFCLDDHVCKYSCTPPKNENELCQLCTKIVNEPMPIGKPPWLLNVLNLSKKYYGTDHHVLLMRCHHSIADAVAAVRLIATCFVDGGFDQLLSSRSYLRLPKKPHQISLLKLTKSVFLIPYYFTKQMLQQDANILHGPRLSGRKLCRLSRPVSLDRVKFVKAITQTTVNDVLLACVGAALESHFAMEKVAAPMTVHAAVAVSFHALREEPELKNKCSSVTFKFRTEAVSSLVRLMQTNRQMASLKTKLFLPINLIWISVVNFIPSCFARILLKFIGTTFILSNVAGPPKACYNNGKFIVSFAGFVPHINKTGIGITFFSYNGQIYFSMSVDDAIISSVKIIDRFLNDCVREVDKLEKEIKKQMVL